MSLKKLPDHKDVKFVDPLTRQVTCSYNKCYSKFVEFEENLVWIKHGTEYPYKKYLHICPDCNRKVSNKTDDEKSRKALIDVRFR
jgi:hypothetical protein